MNNYFTYISGLVVSVALQVLLFNHLSILGGVTFVYLVALIKMPLNFNRILQIIIGFSVGIVIDIFANTHGMHSLTACTVMLFRDPILHLYTGKDDLKYSDVSMSHMGIQQFMRYAISIISIHVLILYAVEAFTLFNFSTILVKALISLMLTWAFSVVWEFAIIKK